MWLLSKIPFGFFSKEFPNVVHSEFELLKGYIEQTEKFFDEHLKEIQEDKFEDSPAGFAPSDKIYAISIQNEFRRTLRNNNFATAVAMLEEHFRSVIRHHPNSKVTLGVDDLKGPNLKIPFTYLTKVLGYDLSHLEPDLSELLDYYEYRNRVVHNLGHIKIEPNLTQAQQSRLFKFLSRFPSITINEELGRVTITDKAFTIDFCSKAESFLLKVIEQLKKT